MKKKKYPDIQTRLTIGLLIIILSFGFSSLFFYKDNKELHKVIHNIFEHSFVVSNSVRDINIDINAIHRSMKDIVLSTNEIELNNAIDLVNGYEQHVYQNFDILNAKFLGDDNSVKEAYTTFANWKPIRDKVLSLVVGNNIDEAAKITKEKGHDHLLLLLDQTNKMIDSVNEQTASYIEQVMILLRQAKIKFLLFSVSSSAVGILLYLWIFYSISSPIKKMIARLKKVSGEEINTLLKSESNQLVLLDYAISDFENREKILEEKVLIRNKELQEARDLLVNSIDNASIGMVEVNLDGQFSSGNQAFCDIVGYSLEEIKGMTFNDLTVEEDKLIGSDFLKEIHEGHNPHLKVQKRYIHKTGRIIYILLSSHVVLNKNEEAQYIFSQIIDITKQKESEQALAAHKNELENLIVERTQELDDKALRLGRSQQALTFLLEDVNDIREQLEVTNNKLVDANKELEAFSYSVSHDLKAPLRAIIGFSQILKEDYAPQLDAESNRYINLIKTNAENMGTLINDLLSFSRMGRTVLQKSDLDLQVIAQRVKGELTASYKDSEQIISIMNMPLVKADEKLMYHVMLNLMSNAIKFTSKVAHPKVEIGCTRENNKDVYYVKDNGVGFDMKYADKIFAVFQRLHTAEEFTGTGIGLSIVQRIIYKHEGKIWVKSEQMNKSDDKKGGTTFFFTL